MDGFDSVSEKQETAEWAAKSLYAYICEIDIEDIAYTAEVNARISWFEKGAEWKTKQLQSTLINHKNEIEELKQQHEHVLKCLLDYSENCLKQYKDADKKSIRSMIYAECIDVLRNLKNSILKRNTLNTF
jgi:hypothetical protein